MSHQKKDKKYLEIAKAIAEDLVPENCRNTRISSILVHKNKIIGVGYNHKKSHTFAARFQKNKEAIYFHGEVHAIYNALKRFSEDELKSMKTTLYVFRAKYNDKKKFVSGLAKPCPGCMEAIKFFDIDRVVYTLEGDTDYPVQYVSMEK